MKTNLITKTTNCFGRTLKQEIFKNLQSSWYQFIVNRMKNSIISKLYPSNYTEKIQLEIYLPWKSFKKKTPYENQENIENFLMYVYFMALRLLLS